MAKMRVRPLRVVWTLLQPGYRYAPLRTRACSAVRLNSVTTSGKVSLWAMICGTPSWSRSRFGSGVMTDRAEKFTRLPLRLPRMRPSLPLIRLFTHLSARPERCCATGRPWCVLSVSTATWYCRTRR